MKIMSLSVAGVILLQWFATAEAQDDYSKQAVETVVKVRVSEDSDTPNAVVLSVRGKCAYSEDGVNFSELNSQHVFTQGAPARTGENISTPLKPQPVFNLTQGAVVRTGADSRVDLFFRRFGTTVRLQPDTEVSVEKLKRSTKHGAPVLETLLDIRKGRIFTAVHAVVPGSIFEIRNAAGRSKVEGAPTGSMGRYIITADGTQVADKSSLAPLKSVRETGITIIGPGQKIDPKEGKPLPTVTPEPVLTLIEFDELHALAEAAEKQPPYEK